jgi:hypothetical protein
MTEKKAKTATPHLRETPEQRQQIEHEVAIEDAGKDGKRVGAGFEKRMASYAPLAKDPLNTRHFFFLIEGVLHRASAAALCCTPSRGI